jgi:osmoprotectant transport system substrate-binding protein
VTLRANLGTREAVEPALAAGQLDLYPDYAGTLLLFLNASDTSAATQTSTAVPALKSLLASHGATVLNPAPALDTDVFAVTHATADKYHLTTLSSVAPVAGQLVLGGPPECPQRPLCLLGLQSTYGLHFKSFTSLDEAGPITVSALKSGEVQIAELFSSDGNIVQNNFVQLTDDKHLQAADFLIPVIRKSVATPAITSALNGLSAKLTTDQLAQLNIKVSVNHDDPATVAQQWLTQEHLG